MNTEGKYFIKTSPYSLCTIHLKTFAKNSKDFISFESILHDNQHEHVIWTVWNGNANSTVKPISEFHEVCTANILIDQGDVLEMDDVIGYMLYSQFDYG
jgi:hypothetical protein